MNTWESIPLDRQEALKRVYEFNSLAENSQNGEEFIDDRLYRFNIEKEKIVDNVVDHTL